MGDFWADVYDGGNQREAAEWTKRLEERCKHSVEFLQMLEIHVPYQAKAQIRDFISCCPLRSREQSDESSPDLPIDT